MRNLDVALYKRVLSEVYRRDGNKCFACGKRKKLYGHHLNGWSWFHEGRYDKNNIRLLCRECHDRFHELYGKETNMNQFAHFLLVYFNKTL